MARSWINKNNLHGPHAFLRFIMLTYVERINSANDEFIFKGGNLLWVYIKTPRSTVDLDFVTRSLKDHDKVLTALEMACQPQTDDNIAFSILSFIPINKKKSLGAKVKINFKTIEGQ